MPTPEGEGQGDGEVKEPTQLNPPGWQVGKPVLEAGPLL